ncbi:hypothetical protein D3C76_607090 [compost metagenome]
MSHSWGERYIAVLGPTGVGLCRKRSGHCEWLGSVGFISDHFPAWPVATETLERLLAEQVRGRAELCVLLSGHYNRFCRVPWSDQINSRDELQAYAGVCFEEVFGLSAQTWTFSLSTEAAGQARVAAAVPDELLLRLRTLANNLSLRLVSVQPYLMAAFNRFDAQLAKDDFLFVVAEPGRSTLLLAREGHWQGVRSVCSPDSDGALAALISRECELFDGDSERPLPVYLHAPGRFDSLPSLEQDAVVVLNAAPAAAVRDVLYVMSQAVN